jgi:hypothetical protein
MRIFLLFIEDPQMEKGPKFYIFDVLLVDK